MVISIFTPDRLIHFVVGSLFFSGYIFFTKRKPGFIQILPGVIAMALGTWVSDWDLWLGIGFHRNPITHSVAPTLAVWFAMRQMKFKASNWILIGFSLGLASHLFWDIIDYGNVIGIPGGTNDRIYLLVNCIMLIVFTLWIDKKNVDKY